ncbi:type II toxin-antitoxin system Phd/YefM family antitoxin [Rhodoferax sp.]|uniref:type II toxin-antitoxin system Phd/YefM family antitoxin n=1 Tax=Rhodoferax sp. TaxID=50421 RepID=UPI00374DBD3B
MQTVNIHEAKTQLSRLIALASQGEPFVIAKAGKPLVKVTAIKTEEARRACRLGFARGMMKVPDDFDRMGGDELAFLFAGGGA